LLHNSPKISIITEFPQLLRGLLAKNKKTELLKQLMME
jgi:hypothetical protein